MPRRKRLPKVPDYTGIAKKQDKMLVQKANALQSLSATAMTLPEFKILDAYLSRIDSRKPDKRYVRFEKGELEQLLGVDKINKADLEKRIDNLFQVITIRDPEKPKGFTKIALFEKAECEQDENGQWQVNLACSASAMEYVFNIENIGYLRYRLKNVVDLTSRYSYILYLYLADNRNSYFRKSWSVSISELKALLRCTADAYNEYYRFNDLVLKKCHREINEKTDIQYSYESIKSGRKVTAVRFTIESPDAVETSDALALPPLEEEVQGESTDAQSEGAELSDTLTATADSCADERDWIAVYGSQRLSALAEACGYEFTREDMEALEACLPRELDDTAACSFLRMLYTRMCAQAKKQPIPHRAEYLQAMARKEPIPKRYVDEGARAPRVKKRENASFTTEDLQAILDNA